MDEFGMGSVCHSKFQLSKLTDRSETSHLPPKYTPVHNPAASGEARSAGGSSGGSAAAVAEGSCWA
jgi:aspartyl-tRNA(Asn)/glutamyl-tRNA(Gln) amidotransferase subunit A